jgi:hypothetical protein
MIRRLWLGPIFVVAAACSDLLRVDWDKIPGPEISESSGGEGGQAGEGGEGGEAGAPIGGAAGDSGEGGDAGEANGGAGGVSGNAGTAGVGGTLGGSAGTAGTAGAAGSSAGGTAGTAGTAGASGNSGAAGSGGSASGAGGTGGGGTGPCGDGVVVEPEICDAPFTVANCGGECLEIEAADCSSCIAGAEAGGCAVFDCSLETGSVQAGPAAGTSKIILCQALLDCMYVSNCAAADPVDCYCGTSGQACQTGAGNGACRAQMEAALETTLFGDIGARIGNPVYTGAVAVLRIDCSRATCAETCGVAD